MKARLPLLAFALAAALAGPAQAVGELIVLQETGPRDRRVNITILAEGYTASERAKFMEHLRTAANAVIRDLPLSRYERYFNVYGVFVASPQSGADNPSRGITRDTYFDARYAGRLLTLNDAKGIPVIRSHVPESDIFFAVVNDATYGESGGQLAVANYANPEIVAHEIQHSFTSLADEYEYGEGPWYDEAPNATAKTARAQIRWSHWIQPSTPVPTPETPAYAQQIGVFEGASTHAQGWYRPKQNCRMRENNTPFCSVCNEAILLEVYDKVSPLDSSFPAARTATFGAGGQARFRVVPKSPASPLKVTWTLDGATVPDAKGPVFERVLAPGRHSVSATVQDTTALVRRDPAVLLRDSVSWVVEVTGTTALRGKPAGTSGWAGTAKSATIEFPRPGGGAAYNAAGRQAPRVSQEGAARPQ